MGGWEKGYSWSVDALVAQEKEAKKFVSLVKIESHWLGVKGNR